ncbi:replicative helicase loader/inhibitor [Bacillus sp. USDA818B3_A]|uniref:replicative helicase loader/inhibitor n=1 Tax=Bacillus sp. USDA818B3_A TaxID=2698834 RepID=UPI00136864E0|nr:replicative helicase loader/inhibitor [Bacillus sp. USDA818B3_A]
MTKTEAVKLLTLIESVYPHFLVKDEMVLLWFQLCSEMDNEKVLEKLKAHIRKSPYPPVIADIAVFSLEETDTWAALQELVFKGHESIKGERGHSSPIPSHWSAEYTSRKTV